MLKSCMTLYTKTVVGVVVVYYTADSKELAYGLRRFMLVVLPRGFWVGGQSYSSFTASIAIRVPT